MAQQPLPLANIPWVNKDGTPSDAFFRFMTTVFPSSGVDVLARSHRLLPITFSQRPPAPQEGMLCFFTDIKATALPPAGTAINTGGGSFHVLAVFIRGNWAVVTAK